MRTFEQIKTVYVSSAVNSTPNCLDWGVNGLVIYGSCNAIHLYDPQITNECDGRVISSFVAHTKRVNSVKWVQILDSCCQQDFVSCSTDNTAILWEDVLPTGSYKAYERLIGHSDVVTINDAIRLANQTLIIVTAAGDCTVKIWIKHKNENTSQCVQTIDFDSILCLSLKITLLSNTNCLLLACGLSNSKIQLYINDFSNGDSVFVSSHSLIGHEDWVRSLDFISEGNLGNLLLASGSQDSVIRLWKFTIEENYNTCKSIKEFDDTLKLESKKFNVTKQDGSECIYVIQLETVISGHDGWIYGVHWKPPFGTGKFKES
uniref:Elongator complex protein 2 n=1 Tax=Melanaphis sacchari TaxID=742174 RepID=A0A2H8TKM3_9HEMI